MPVFNLIILSRHIRGFKLTFPFLFLSLSLSFLHPLDWLTHSLEKKKRVLSPGKSSPLRPKQYFSDPNFRRSKPFSWFLLCRWSMWCRILQSSAPNSTNLSFRRPSWGCCSGRLQLEQSQAVKLGFGTGLIRV